MSNIQTAQSAKEYCHWKLSHQFYNHTYLALIRVDKNLAFEWCNFRLCFEILNQNKGSETIIDPFRIEENWFVIDFDTNLVKSNKELDSALREIIDDTIS